MNKEDFKKKVLELEQQYVNFKVDRATIVQRILSILEEEWENETEKSDGE